MERKPKEVLQEIREKLVSYQESGDGEILSEIEEDYAQLFDMIATYFFLTENPYTSYFSSLEKRQDYQMEEKAKIQILENGDSYFVYQPLLLSSLSLEEILSLIVYLIEYVNTPLPLLYHKQEYQDTPALKDGILKQLYEQYRPWNNIILRNKEDQFFQEGLEKVENLAKGEGNLTSRAFYQAVRMAKKGQSVPEEIKACFSLDSLSGIEEQEAKKVFALFLSKNKEGKGGELRGEHSGDGVEEIKVKKEKKIYWQRELRNLLGGVPYGKRHTHMRLNRRQPLRSDLSGTLSDRRAKLIVAVDTSYSMDKEQIEKALSQILQVKKDLNFDMTLIECDSKIQEIIPIRKTKDIPSFVRGRGGTAFTPVIDYLNDHRECRGSILIYFTDGYGEKKIPKPLVRKVLWVIIGERTYLSLKEPYGLVLPYERKER